MNMYSSDVFLRTMGEVYFAGRRHEPALFVVDERAYRLLVVDGVPIARWQFVDFFEPVTAPGGPRRNLGYLPYVARETLASEDWLARPPAAGVHPSPLVDWAHFHRWEDYLAVVSARVGNLAADSRRKRNRLAREVGDVEFRLDDRRPETLELGMKWKSAQYLASGHDDLFADARNRRLFSDLQGRGLALVSSLSAGGKVVAVHLGASHEGRTYWWIPSYGPEFSRFSPGRLMMEAIMRASLERGDKEFDFLIGGEAYKWHYATHVRVIGHAGVPPLARRIETGLKWRVKRALRGMPWLLKRWPRLERRVQA